MTYLIDISGHQIGLDIALVREAGNEAVIVKAVAADERQHTVAAGYRAHIDNVIRAGLPKGHYAIPNSENPPAVLAKFLYDNRYRPADTDVYMLDNEPLDDFKVYWRDDNAAAFFEALHDLGIRYDQMWLYCPAALTRAARYWPKIKALRAKGLKIVWVSYGDMDPYREDGEEPFTGDTGLDNPEVHQFTSTYRVPGYGGNLDRNYSPHPISYLFGGGIVSLESKAREFAAKYPTPASHPSGGDGSWDQDCGRVMFRFGSYLGWSRAPGGDISSAYRAYRGSKIESLNAVGAPVGAYHWWDIGGEANGHVMQQVDGNALVFGGTETVWEDLGVDIGFMSVAEYNRQRPTARYLGWSRDYSGGRVNLASTAGLGYDLIEEEQKQGDIMARYIWAPGRAGVLVKLEEGGIYYPATVEEAEGLSVATNGIDVSDRMWDVLRQTALNIQAANGDVIGTFTAKLDAVFTELAKIVKDSAADVDEAKLAAALGPILKAQGIEAKVDAQALADVFLNAQAKRLGA